MLPIPQVKSRRDRGRGRISTSSVDRAKENSPLGRLSARSFLVSGQSASAPPNGALGTRHSRGQQSRAASSPISTPRERVVLRAVRIKRLTIGRASGTLKHDQLAEGVAMETRKKRRSWPETQACDQADKRCLVADKTTRRTMGTPQTLASPDYYGRQLSGRSLTSVSP